MTLQALAELALAFLILAATPGPGTLTVSSTAATRGFRAGAALAVGIVAGDCLFLVLSVCGLAALARTLGLFFLLVKIAGAAYLVLLGVKLLLGRPQRAQDEGSAVLRARRNVAGGFALTMTNPKAMLFYLGFLPAFLDLRTITTVDLALLITVVAAVVGTVLLAYAAVAAQAGKRPMGSRFGLWFRRAAGAVLIGAGLRIATA